MNDEHKQKGSDATSAAMVWSALFQLCIGSKVAHILIFILIVVLELCACVVGAVWVGRQMKREDSSGRTAAVVVSRHLSRLWSWAEALRTEGRIACLDSDPKCFVVCTMA